MEQNRGARLGDSSVRILNRSLNKQIQKQIERIDLLINEHIAGSQELSAKAHKLTAISGVGPRTAALLLAQMPELGQLNRLIATAANCAANVPSSAVAATSVTVFTWQL
jgi:transposase